MFEIQASHIDKTLPIPVGTQLRGLLVSLISHGAIEPGSRLPSVRDLSAELGLAVVTVNQVYQQLSESGLIEIRRGLGAFAVEDPKKMELSAGPANALKEDIAALLRKATDLGVSPIDLVALVSGQAQLGSDAGLDIVFIAPFLPSTKKYIADIKPYLHANDKIRPVTLDTLADEKVRRKCQKADMVLTVANREHEIREKLPEANVVAIRLVVSDESKAALQALPAASRIAAVMSVQDYIATLRPGILGVAPHLSDIRVTWLTAPDLKDVILDRQVVVYTSGAESAARIAPHLPSLEYRYAPDPRHVQSMLVPLLTELRSGKKRIRTP